MRNKLILFLIISVVVQNLYAVSEIDKAQIQKKQEQTAITQFSATAKEESVLPSDVGCPAGGFKVFPGTTVLTGSLASAKESLSKLGLEANAQAQKIYQTNSCGSCKPRMHLTQFVVTKPAKISYQAFCDGRPTMNFEADFQSDEEAEQYSQDIIRKKNSEGKRLYAGCPDPCAFSVYAGKRKLSNGKTKSITTVVCGQPRNTSILFAKYSYTFGNTAQWSCHK